MRDTTANGRLPIAVLGGWLGSGKTTQVNRLLASGTVGRIAVVVNDVGEINIDARLIASHDGETVELVDGCICCSIGDSLALTLRDLVLQPHPPTGIVIEASGIADPTKVAAYGDRRRVYCSTIAVTVDATAVRQQAIHPTWGPMVRQQVRAANVLLLTKTDLDPASGVDAVEWCRDLAPDTEIIDVQRSPGLALAALAPGNGDLAQRASPAPTAALDGLTTSVWHPDPLPTLHEVRSHLEAEVLTGLARAKGVIDTTDGRRLVHLAGNRISAEPCDLDVTGIVMIRTAPAPGPL